MAQFVIEALPGFKKFCLVDFILVLLQRLFLPPFA